MADRPGVLTEPLPGELVSRAQTKWAASELWRVAADTPVVGHRVWAVSAGRLVGIYRQTAWAPQTVERAAGFCGWQHREPVGHSCDCGLWTYTTLDGARADERGRRERLERRRRLAARPGSLLEAPDTGLPRLLGGVALWGHVRVHDTLGGREWDTCGRPPEPHVARFLYRGEVGRIVHLVAPDSVSGANGGELLALAERVAGAYRVPLIEAG